MQFKKEVLDGLVSEGWLISQRHPSLDLTIYNYSQRTQYEGHWIPETLAARGLVLNDAGDIAARPFGKFFNLTEHRADEIPDLPFEVFEKMDGSLGIFFFYQGQPIFASRGSFTSDQALRGWSMLKQRNYETLDPAYTWMWEIIYPENRIVVDYEGLNDVVLLGARHTRLGVEMPYETLKQSHQTDFSVVKAYRSGETPGDIERLCDENPDNREGYVIRYSNGFRVKVKFEEYVRLHRIVTCVSSISIWDMLRNGDGIDAIIDNVPDEFYDWVKEVVDKLTGEKEAIIRAARDEFRLVMMEISPEASRKDIALAFAKSPYKSYLFNLLDDRLDAVNALAWKQVRPQYSTPFKKITAEVS